MIQKTRRADLVVYVNGKEVVRGHLPAGAILPETLADPYPLAVYTQTDSGTAIRWGWGEPERFKEAEATLRDTGAVEVKNER